MVKVTEEEIKAIIKKKVLKEVQEIEQDIVERVFILATEKINSLMTHRKSVIFYTVSLEKSEVKKFMLEELH
jgi:putative hemolysin